jgi:hypothetical protein
LETLKKWALAIAALAGAILAFIFLGGKSKTGEADATALKAKALREKADLIDAEIARLKAEKGKLDADTKKEVERIKQMEDLDEISDAFSKL